MPQQPFSRVSVLGLGYIGLPTAAVLANRGIEVIGVDVVPDVVKTINGGRIHIVEPELDVLVSAAVNSGKLRAVVQPEPADAFIIAVPTPFKDGHVPDLSYIEAAAYSLAEVLKPGNLVILESTSPVGTTEKLVAWLREKRPDLCFPEPELFPTTAMTPAAATPTAANTACPPCAAATGNRIYVAHCPERVLPGRVLQELVENDRVVGGITPACAARATELYGLFVRGNCLATTARTAELVKLSENAFRDVNIAYANELSLICDRLGINVWELIELANRHPRVNILTPGPGVGGHCIAVDPWFIVDAVPEQARLIRTAREVNDGKPEIVRARIRDAANRFKRPVIACLGLSFKPDIDDLRESPALDIVRKLDADHIGEVLSVEPHVLKAPPQLDGTGVKFVDLATALAQADVVAILVRHRQFRALNVATLDRKVVLDFVDALGRR